MDPGVGVEGKRWSHGPGLEEPGPASLPCIYPPLDRELVDGYDGINFVFASPAHSVIHEF